MKSPLKSRTLGFNGASAVIATALTPITPQQYIPILYLIIVVGNIILRFITKEEIGFQKKEISLPEKTDIAFVNETSPLRNEIKIEPDRTSGENVWFTLDSGEQICLYKLEAETDYYFYYLLRKKDLEAVSGWSEFKTLSGLGL